MKISVCLATYNGAKFIKEQLESILPQLGVSDEIIISDDHSSDNTLQIITEINDDRIKVFKNFNPKGIVGNFENALRNSTGDYIFLSDQDDVWLPNKVVLSCEALEKFDIIVTNCKIVDTDLNIINESYFKLNNSRAGFLKNFYRSSYLGCCVAFRKELLNIILPIPAHLFLYHDWWIGFLAAIKYTTHFISEPCLLYRRHDHNMSTTGGVSRQSLFKKIRDRFQLFFYGVVRLIKI